jgi:hypothetical protein
MPAKPTLSKIKEIRECSVESIKQAIGTPTENESELKQGGGFASVV